jgi:hypothetical protein
MDSAPATPSGLISRGGPFRKSISPGWTSRGRRQEAAQRLPDFWGGGFDGGIRFFPEGVYPFEPILQVQERVAGMQKALETAYWSLNWLDFCSSTRSESGAIIGHFMAVMSLLEYMEFNWQKGLSSMMSGKRLPPHLRSTHPAAAEPVPARMSSFSPECSVKEELP